MPHRVLIFDVDLQGQFAASNAAHFTPSRFTGSVRRVERGSLHTATPQRAQYVGVDAHAEGEAEVASGEAYLREALGKTLEELALPARAINALKGADMHLVADLVQKSETDLVDVKNLGEKSIDEIKTALAALGLSLGMRIDPNVLGALGRGTAGGLR